MFIVVAVDRNWAIGKNGGLLYRIPHDMANFRELTIGKTIVYGRKTLETFPHGRPLKGRTNIILTRDEQFSCEGATIIHSTNELSNYSSRDLYIIGGANVYQQLYRKCEYAFVTYIDNVTLGCDAFFPNLEAEGWERVVETPMLYYQGLPYQFISYRNPNPVD